MDSDQRWTKDRGMRGRLPTFAAAIRYGLIRSFSSADVCRRLFTEPSHGENRGAQLFIFLKRDHGALLQVTGRPRNALQYEIGNPHTASKMTRHRLAAGLYAPLSVILYEDETGVQF
jgi:Domain of unknown function DUF302